MSILEHVSEGQMARFIQFFDNEFWYRTDSGFDFPIPYADAKGATFLATDKAIYFMRWVRKHMTLLENAEKAIILKKLSEDYNPENEE